MRFFLTPCRPVSLSSHDNAAHQRRCCACEQWSCDQCGLHRADGDGVVALAQRLGAKCFAIVFDFDQTLCSTKSGAAPVVGRHTLQAELQTLLPQQQGLPNDDGVEEEGSARVQRPKCCVATRNSHGRDIESFLIASGVAVVCTNANCTEDMQRDGNAGEHVTAAGMLVHCVNAQGRTKADVALQLLAEAPEDGVVILIDDDLRELVMDDRLIGGRVHRVFFSPRELG